MNQQRENDPDRDSHHERFEICPFILRLNGFDFKDEAIGVRLKRVTSDVEDCLAQASDVQDVLAFRCLHVAVWGDADCFKYRNKIGLDVAIEALQDCRRSRKATVDQLWEAAKACRMANVMRP